MKEGLIGFVIGALLTGGMAYSTQDLHKEPAKKVNKIVEAKVEKGLDAKNDIVTIDGNKRKIKNQKVFIIDKEIYVSVVSIADMFQKKVYYKPEKNLINLRWKKPSKVLDTSIKTSKDTSKDIESSKKVVEAKKPRTENSDSNKQVEEKSKTSSEPKNEKKHFLDHLFGGH